MSQSDYTQIIRAPSRERLDLFLATANRLGAPVGNIEKDFWVCWILDALYHRLPPGGPRLLFKRTSRWLFAQLRQGRTLRERHATRRWRGRLSGRRPLGMATWSQRKSPESAMCSHPTGEVWLSRSSGAGSTVVRKCATASAM